MSNDIATLGLAVDSSQVVAANTALAQLATAANQAGTAAGALQTSTGGVTSALTAVGSGANNATGFFNANTESLRGQRLVLSAIAGDLALFGGGLGQAAAVAGTLYIQNAHLFEGFGGLKSAISSMLTPTTAIVATLAVLAVGAYEATDAIVKQEQAFDDLSTHSNTAMDALHGLASAASFKGIDNTDFLKDMTQFEAQTAQAANNMGSLNELLRANGESAGTLQQNLMNVANLVANASTEAAKYQIVQEAGLPATRQWVDFLSQGSAGIQSATAQAVLFGGAADKQLIQKAHDFESEWNTTWTNWETSAKSAFVNVEAFAASLNEKIRNGLIAASSAITGADTSVTQTSFGATMLKQGYGTQLQTGSSAVSGFYKGLTGAATSDSLKSSTTSAALKQTITDEQPLLGLIGTLAPVAQTKRQSDEAEKRESRKDNDRNSNRRAA
jgi:hypothetical protein